MTLDIAVRSEVVEKIRLHLGTVVPGSEVLLRGSLAEDRADMYSDIDLLWEVPDDTFASAVAELSATLESVRPLSSLRFDPDFQCSDRRRLAFARFTDLPIFWRVDLDILAASVGRDPDYDRNNVTARGSDWSLTESALMNVVAVVKAERRGNPHLAVELLTRAEERVGFEPTDGSAEARMASLVTAIANQDSAARPLAAEILGLLGEGQLQL